VRERFELRELLEPEALRRASDQIDYEQIRQVVQHERDRTTPAGDSPTWVDLDQMLMTHCIMRAPNAHLIELIQQNRLPLAAASRALTKLGLPKDEIAAHEYLVLFELIAGRAIEAAATYWQSHLTALAEKNLARLKIVAVVADPAVGVPYLTPLDTYE
jgi:DNA-binding GntR family transcriptional regulator